VRNNYIHQFEVHTFDKIVLSPGPGLPIQAKGMMEIIERFHTHKPMLGVCLGMQAIAEFFGGKLYNLNDVKHGISETASIINSSKLFNHLPTEFDVGLYHSWAVHEPLPSVLLPTLRSKKNTLMAFEHRTLPIAAVQFHPESILTPHGREIIQNFLKKY
jgi:anthranilate synthase component 2